MKFFEYFVDLRILKLLERMKFYRNWETFPLWPWNILMKRLYHCWNTIWHCHLLIRHTPWQVQGTEVPVF